MFVRAPALTLSTTAANAGDSLAITLDDPPPLGDSWLALSRVGDADTSYIEWIAVDESQNPFVWNTMAPEFGGSWEARLFTSGSFDLAATSATLTVTEAAGTGSPDLKFSASFVAPSDTLTVRVLDGPGNSSDRLYIGDVDKSVSYYHQPVHYSSNNTDFDGDFPVPDVAGPIDSRFVQHGSWTVLAREGSISITGDAPVAPSSAIAVYEYDAVGNRTSQAGSVGQTAFTYGSSSNRLESATGAAACELGGNTTGRGSDTPIDRHDATHGIKCRHNHHKLHNTLAMVRDFVRHGIDGHCTVPPLTAGADPC